MELFRFEDTADVVVQWLKSFFNMLKFFIIDELSVQFKKLKVKRSSLLSIMNI